MTSRAWFRVGYVALFSVVLPLALVLWARRLDTLLSLPAIHSPRLGVVIAVFGAGLAGWATWAMWNYGRGFPASPFPPRRFVREGAYRYLAHPIYVGFVALAFGVAMVAGSGAGTWVVVPVFAAAIVAWVMGYEAGATRARYGDSPKHPRGTRFVVARVTVPWQRVLKHAERIANSWGEVSVGPVRFFRHGLFAAVGAALGVWVQLALSGPTFLPWAMVLVAAAVSGAAIWAQLVEGSPQLLRPFGYFGSVVGVSSAAALAASRGVDGWLLFASFGVGCTITSAVGRLRCLVQGCCHGAPTTHAHGIVYSHPQSRVVRLSGLGGVPLYPTPIYSMLWSLGVGAVMLLLWFLRAPLPFIAGVYFMLAGLGRFVEEHYRGEPQTMVIGGLRLYQWLALSSLIAGAFLTIIPGQPAPVPVGLNIRLLPWLLLVAAAAFLAYGVDFPRGRRRFSRLV